jgi:2-keto-4-pentenoate hydratase
MRLAAPADGVADALWRAQADGARVPSPSATLPGLDLPGAYAIQEALVARLVAAGQRPIGWKVGMAGVVGRTADSPGPIYGRLLSAMVVAPGGTLSAEALHEPFAEGEIAFVLRDALHGPGVEADDVRAAAAGVCPAIEVFARRLDADAAAVTDMVADNALCAHVVLGDVVELEGASARAAATDGSGPAGRGPAPLDLRLVGLVMRRRGEIVATGAGAAVLGDPARSVAWLANALAERGQGLEAGEVVITGAVAGAHAAAPGDAFTVEFDRLGAVEVHCA